jgi:hypothetical protein
MPSVLVHLQNEDPVLGEIEALPGLADTLVCVKNPRRRDGKDLHYLEANVSLVMWPVSRINFIEVIPSAEEEEVIAHFRE